MSRPHSDLDYIHTAGKCGLNLTILPIYDPYLISFHNSLNNFLESNPGYFHMCSENRDIWFFSKQTQSNVFYLNFVSDCAKHANIYSSIHIYCCRWHHVFSMHAVHFAVTIFHCTLLNNQCLDAFQDDLFNVSQVQSMDKVKAQQGESKRTVNSGVSLITPFAG